MKKILKKVLIAVIVIGCLGSATSIVAVKNNLISGISLNIPFVRTDKIKDLSNDSKLSSELEILKGDYTYDRQTVSINYTEDSSVFNYTKNYDYISNNENINQLNANLLIVNLSDYYNKTGNDFKSSMLYTSLVSTPGMAKSAEKDGYLYIYSVSMDLGMVGEINLPDTTTITKSKAISIEKSFQIYKLYAPAVEGMPSDNFKGKNNITISEYNNQEESSSLGA